MEVAYTTVLEDIPVKMLTISVSDGSICDVSMSEEAINFSTQNPGTATITLEASNGVKGELKLVVHDVKPEKVEFQQEEYDLGVNNTFFLDWKLVPKNAFSHHLEIAADESIVQPLLIVSEHLKIGTVAEGTSEVKVLCDGEEIGSTVVHSVYKPLEDIVLEFDEYTGAPGIAYTSLELIPFDASQSEIIIESSDPEVADGVFVSRTGLKLDLKKPGSAVLTFRCAGISKTLPITVISQPVESLVFPTPMMKIAADAITPTPIKISPADADTSTISFTSSDEEVARVVMDMLPYIIVIESMKEGTAVITATAESGATASMTVISALTEAVDISGFEEEMSINVKDTYTISYSLTPHLPSRSENSFVSDNPDVCQVVYEDYAYCIRGISPGTANITLTLKNGRSATCVVTVTDPAACKVFGFCTYEGRQYWFEDGKRQGMYGDPQNVTDTQFGGIDRGREIYDPETDAWYWLDALYDGAAAVDKEVWMPYVFRGDDNPEGKWIRYDSQGKMIKGWYEADETIYPDQKGNTYYYDPLTGAMAKGKTVIDGNEYSFDELTGALIR